ncbi:MAG TPA: ribonuclease H [Acidimicrobiales bacterium]|nr:ribonuclease H [Acidimicrobiales bacterium]
MTTTVYTDGACMGNPGPGGWAWAIPGGRFAAGPEPRTTNQRMEIRAALEALRAIAGPVEVVSDSTYVVNCFRDRWWEGWLARGWVNSKRKPVANRDLWEPLVELVRTRAKEVRWRWVKGHGDDPVNDMVDRLAVEAARTQQPRAGDRPPDDLGPADSPPAGRAPGGDAEAPPGRRLVVAGLRPPALGGYDPNPLADAVRDRLAAVLGAKAQLHPDLVVLSGLGLGAEQLGAEAAAKAGVAYAAVLPYPSQESVWPRAARERYRRLLDEARDEVLLQSAVPTSKQQAGGALARRNAWLARHAHEAVVVWDGDEPSTGRLVRSLRDHLGEEEVWIVSPAELR